MTEPSFPENPIEDLAEEFLARYRRGENPSVSEYVRRSPENAQEVRDLIATLLLMEEARPRTQDGQTSGTRSSGRLDDARVDRIGDYRILREVGRGGMGIVYEAEQLSLGRHVALKVLPAHALLDPRHLTRFHREARAAARLHHTNIVPVFGVGDSESLHYYVMQFITGLGLDKVLEEIRKMRGSGGEPRPSSSSSSLRFPGQELGSQISEAGGDYWRAVARIGVQVADALEYAAQQGVLHRDIKPSNLLLDARGTVWVTDFGLARTTDEEELTQTGDLVGTLRYMAPERLKGHSDVRSDIYGLGLTLYELLAMRPAFTEKDRHELLRQVAEVDPPRLDKVDSTIPRDLVTVVEKAIAKSPADRYPSAGAMADDLRRFLDDRPIAARRVGQLERTWRWCKRNKTVACLLLLIATLGLLVSALAFAERRSRLVAEKAQSKGTEAEIVQVEKTRVANDAQLVADFLAREVIFPGSSPHGHTNRPCTLDALAKAEQKIPGMFKDNPLAEATLRFRLGKCYFRNGETSRAREHLSIAYELRKSHNGPEHHETLESMDFLALALREEGRFEEARRLREEMLSIVRRSRGAASTDANTCLQDIMLILKDQGELERARALCEEILASERRDLGPEDDKTVDTMENLVLVLRAQGMFESARKVSGDVLEIRRRRYGPQDRRTLLSTSLHTLVLKDLKELDQALDLGRNTLDAQRKILGEDHSETLFTACNVSLVLKILGRKEEARALCERTLETGHCFLVSDHPDATDPKMLESVLEYIDAFEREGKLDKAEILARELLGVCGRFLGWGHEKTLAVLDRAVGLLERQGKHSDIASLRAGIEIAKGSRN